MRRAVGDALHEPLLDLRERPLRDEQVGVAPAEQAVDDRVDDQRADLEAQLPVELLGLEQVEAGRVRQRVDELAVGELLDVRDGDFDDRAEVPGEGGAEVSPEAFVQGFQGPHLVLGDALGALEVVDLGSSSGMRLMLRGCCRRGRCGGGGRSGSRFAGRCAAIQGARASRVAGSVPSGMSRMSEGFQ
jgi:hypothetical protein